MTSEFPVLSLKCLSLFLVGSTRREFGDYYTKAIDETWYKAAILQHKIDPDSFVYSVPHDDPDDTAKEDGERKVTASYAIFRKDGLDEAPGCVVGFQFEQQKMNDRFFNITSKDHVSSFWLWLFDFRSGAH